MDKKYIKIIKHLYKNLQKKDELKKEFDKVSNSILLYSFLSIYTCIFISSLFLLGTDIHVIFFSSISSLFFGFLSFSAVILICKANIFNNLISKKLSKHNLFNLYGRNYLFDSFLYNIMEEIIKNNEKDNLNKYAKEIIHIINAIPDDVRKNNIKMKFIEKMQIDIDYQLINLNENNSEEENVIKIDSKSIVVNN